MKIEETRWWPEAISLKDKLSLRELAAKFGVSAGQLSTAFKSAGVVRNPGRPGSEAPAPASAQKPVQEERPGAALEAPVTEAALTEPSTASTTASPSNVEAKLALYVSQLGITPDEEIATLAGVGLRAVADYRRARGIHNKVGRKPRAATALPPTPSAHVDVALQEAEVVKERGDVQVAEPVALEEQLVDQQLVEDTPDLVEEARPWRRAVLYAWRVTFAGMDGMHERVVVGSNAPEAIAAASRGAELGVLVGLAREAALLG